MFGSDIIRVRVQGYLKNINDNEILTFDEKGIKNKNKIIYTNSGVKYSIKIEYEKIILIREGNNFISTLVFSKKKSSGNYFLKNEGYDVDINVETFKINTDDNFILIEYKVIDSDVCYEFNVEVSEIL